MKDITPDDDAELLRRARGGDRDAFAAIVTLHQTAALRLATVITGDSTEADDIVQEAFVRAYRSLATVRSGESLRPWLMRIVANQAKNSQRSRWRSDRRADRQGRMRLIAPTGPEDAALGEIEAEALLHALADLSARDRDVLACRYFAEMSEAETSIVLGVARGTVKSRTARALVRLRAGLDPAFGDAWEVAP